MFYTDVKSLPIESGTQRTLVTAAHLGEIDGYTQVYVDEDTDFAIYVKEGYIAEGLSLSDVVSLAGTTGTVSSVSGQEFSVVVDDISKIVPGCRVSLYTSIIPPLDSSVDGMGMVR